MPSASKLYMFRSGASAGLHGFAAESSGARLPAKFAPWAGIGVLRPDQSPPHGLQRAAIEEGVAKLGYQMWRRKNKT